MEQISEENRKHRTQNANMIDPRKIHLFTIVNNFILYKINVCTCDDFSITDSNIWTVEWGKRTFVLDASYVCLRSLRPGPEVIDLFSCSTQLSM